MWIKFKEFFAWLWGEIKQGGKWVIGGLIALILIVAGIFSLNNNENNKNTSSDSRPEVAQVYEPSIGTPLPPDTSEGKAEVSGAVTNTPSTAEGTNQNDTTNSTAQQTTYIAPSTGVDDNKPFVYKNSDLNFQALLDGGTQVEERSEGIKFTSKSGKLLFYVTVSKSGSETHDSLVSQLSASTMTSQISKTSFLGLPAVNYLQNNQNALAVLKTNSVYYIVGEQKYFKNISL